MTDDASAPIGSAISPVYSALRVQAHLSIVRLLPWRSLPVKKWSMSPGTEYIGIGRARLSLMYESNIISGAGDCTATTL